MVARVYRRTGFNAVNLPLVPTILDNGTFEYEDTQTIDIIQPAELSEIKLRLTGDIKPIDIDLIRLDNDVYYLVNGFDMTSADVAVFYVTMSYSLTIGGYYDQDFSDGFVTRTTAITGAYGEITDLVDNLLTLNYECNHRCYSMYNADESTSDYIQYRTNEFRPAPAGGDGPINFDGSTDGWNVFVSPYSKQNPADIVAVTNAPITIEKTDTIDIYSLNYQNQAQILGKPATSTTTIGTMFYTDFEQPQKYEYPGGTMYTKEIMDTALALYGYGVPNPITDAYVIPKGFVHATIDKTNGKYEEILSNSLTCEVKDNLFDIVIDKHEDLMSYKNAVIENILNSTVNIKMTAVGSGESQYMKPQFMEYKTKIRVDMMCDPSPKGAPYFKIRDKITFKNSGTFPYGESLKILNGAVRGGTWQRIPIAFSGYGYNRDNQYNRYQLTAQAVGIANTNAIQNDLALKQAGAGLISDAFSVVPVLGSDIAHYSIQNNQMQADYDRAMAANSKLGNTAARWKNDYNLTTQFADQQGALQANIATGMISSAVGGLTSMGMRTANTAMTREARNRYAEEALRQVSNANQLFGIANTAVQYDVHFNSIDTLQALVGNGVVLEITYPIYEDVLNCIRIMQRYGMPAYHPLDGVDFLDAYDNGYCFIQTNGCRLSQPANSKWPSRYYDLAAAELDGGKRLWTVKPDVSLYDKKFKKEEGTANVV